MGNGSKTTLATDDRWDLDTYKRYREVVKNWAVQYIGEGQSIVFSAELDLRSKKYLDAQNETHLTNRADCSGA